MNELGLETSLFFVAGAKVSDTVRKGIIDPSLYSNQTDLFMVGNVAALSGTDIRPGKNSWFPSPATHFLKD